MLATSSRIQRYSLNRSLRPRCQALAMSTTAFKITMSTPILAIGHHPGHIRRKVELLQEAGFTKAEGIVMNETTVSDVKDKLAATPDGLFLVGGAMMKTHAEKMKEMLDFIAASVPSMMVYTISKSDFPEDLVFPPTEEDVAVYSVKACQKLLE